MAIVWSGGQGAFRGFIDAINKVRNQQWKISRRRRLQIEAAGQGIAALAIVFGMGSAAFAGIRSFSQKSPFVPITPTVPMTVHNGDTLWNLAQRYGNPEDSQWDRVDALAHANGLSGGETLVPGQRLLVPVENPTEVDRYQTMMAVR